MRSESCRHSEKEHPNETSHRRRDDQAQHQPCMIEYDVQARYSTFFDRMRKMRKEEELKWRRSEFIKRRE